MKVFCSRLLHMPKQKRANLTFNCLPRKSWRWEWLDKIGLVNIRPESKDIYMCAHCTMKSAFNKTINIFGLRDDAIPPVFEKASFSIPVSPETSRFPWSKRRRK